MEDLNTSLNQYRSQLTMVNQTLESTTDEDERDSLITLQSDLQQLIQLTEENVAALFTQDSAAGTESKDSDDKNNLDEEYALFMQEMASADTHKNDSNGELIQSKDKQLEQDEDSDIENELDSLLGMKCAVYHTHKWGGQPSLHNAMVSAVVPRQDDDQFKDLQVQVLFTHPTHAEMLPCPFYYDGECRFNDELCRYSHGAITQLSNLKEAIEPNFAALRIGSRILMKLKPPDDEDISLTKKSSEKYHLWHRAVVKSIDADNKICIVKMEHGINTGEKRKAGCDEYHVRIEDIFPLNTENDEDSESDDSISDTEYPDSKAARAVDNQALLIEQSLQNNTPAMGEWERHTKGIGSKLLLAMGYVPGTGLGARGGGRLLPVEARAPPAAAAGLDRCLALANAQTRQDPLKVQKKLKRLQKKEEERNKRAYEREKEREKRNVFHIINTTIGDKLEQESVGAPPALDVKQSTSKDLNIEKFKIEESAKKIERELMKLNSSLGKHAPGSNGYRTINLQIAEKNKELCTLQRREQQISKEQRNRKDKEKMTVF